MAKKNVKTNKKVKPVTKKNDKENKKVVKHNKGEIIATIVQYLIVAALLAVVAFNIAEYIINREGILMKDFKQQIFQWMFIILAPIFAAIAAGGFAWFAVTQKNRTYRSFMVITIIAAVYALVSVGEYIAAGIINTTGKTMIIVVISNALISTSIVSFLFAVSQRSLSIKRTLAFLVSALIMSIVPAAYITATIVFKADRSDIYIATALSAIWLKTLVIAALTSIYVVRIFNILPLKDNIQDKK